MAQEDIFKKLVAHCKEYGYVFPVIRDIWRAGCGVRLRTIRGWTEKQYQKVLVGLNGAVTRERGRIGFRHFHAPDYLESLRTRGMLSTTRWLIIKIQKRDTGQTYWSKIILPKYDDKIEKDVAKAKKRFGEKFDETLYRQTNPQVLENIRKKEELTARMAKALNDNDLVELRQIIVDNKIVCPISGTSNWTEVRQFNLMFSTEMGSTAEGASKIYLRPETAQGIFVNFLNVQKSGRMKVPFRDRPDR